MLSELTRSETLLPRPFLDWFAARGWAVRPHQWALLEKAQENENTLLIAPTGAGKTLAGFLPTLVDFAPSAPRAAGCTLFISRR